MITKNIYDIPYPETTPADMDGVKSFLDNTLLPFLAEKMGLVVRSDLAVMAPDYAPYSYITFLAPSANEDPCLAVWRSNYNNTSMNSAFAISAVTKSENTFRPNVATNGMTINLASSYVRKWSASIALQAANFQTNKSSLVIIDMGDGRKIAAFRTIAISSGVIQYPGEQCSIYFGDIKMNGDTVNTCIVMAGGFNTPYFEDYEQPASSIAISEIPKNATNTYIGLMGFIYSNSIGKEYLISLDLCIGEDAYLPNCLWYSDCQRRLSAGSIFEIDNKKYVCVLPTTDYGFRLIIPEEVN